MKFTTVAAIVSLCHAAPLLAAEPPKVREEKAFYAITGRTPVELYRSIGERGPLVGGKRAIASTTFKLLWTRHYKTEGTACLLESAAPKLTITYRLPKPASRLDGEAGSRWNRFLAGISDHEKQHGVTIIDMMHEIEAATIGLREEDDPHCKRIKDTLTKKLGAISQRQRQRGRDFDKDEMGPRGNVQRLVLAFVNGPG